METPEDDDLEEAVPERHRPSRRVLALALTPIAIVSAIAFFSRGIRPTLIADHPLLLLAIEPSTLFMGLVQDRISAGAFYAVVIFRRLMLDPIYFLLGRWYGNTALHWLQRQSPGVGELVEAIERHFPRFGPVIVAIYPQPLVFVIAGASRMRFWVFMACDALNTLVIVYAVRRYGYVVEGPANSITDFITRYQIPLTVLSVGLVVYLVIAGRRSGKSTLPTVSGMTRDLEDGDKHKPRD